MNNLGSTEKFPPLTTLTCDRIGDLPAGEIATEVEITSFVRRGRDEKKLGRATLLTKRLSESKMWNF